MYSFVISRPPDSAALAPLRRRVYRVYGLTATDACHQLCQDAPLACYEVGHMMYIHVPSLPRMKQELAKFVRESSGA